MSLLSFRPRTGLRAALCVLALLAAGASSTALDPVPSGKPSTYPDWWFQRSVIPRIDPGSTTPLWPGGYQPRNDFAVLNQGQLKRLATAAFDEMEQNWAGAGGAGSEVTDMVKGWFQLNPDNTFQLDGNGARIPKTSADNYAAVNLGQLKAVSRPFYNRFIAKGLIFNYPWDFSIEPADDFAAANLGQAKNVFRFATTGLDLDGNNLPDWFEAATGLDGSFASGPSNGNEGDPNSDDAPFSVGSTGDGPFGGPIPDDGVNPPDFDEGVTFLTRTVTYQNEKEKDSIRAFD
jgi:hypothetical protein